MHGIRAALLIVLASLFAIEPLSARTLSGEEIEQTIVGKRLFLKAPITGEIPLHYRRNGSVTGDGTKVGLGRFLTPKETGRWWIEGNRICQQWPTWYKGRQFCFTVEQVDENRIKWQRDDGRSGISRISN